jgi:GMP synthase (glutamine-hydrolysing)
MPFPGPALSARIIGEVTADKLKIVRQATEIVEHKLKDTDAFQYLAILHNDRVTGMLDGKRVYGMQIEIRSWQSIDARTARPSRLSWNTLAELGNQITAAIPEVVSVTYNLTSKPPSTIEAI